MFINKFGFRNIFYNAYNKQVTLFGWDEEGNRIEKTEEYKPYIYIEDANGKDGISIYNTKLKKIEFENSFDRSKLAKTVRRVFGNVSPEQQYLIDKFQGLNKKTDFGCLPLKIYYLDIEVRATKGFPDPQKAEEEITLISIYDSLINAVYTFGLKKEYTTSATNVFYKCFENEQELIKGFLRFWRKDFPDVVTGWNIWGFDIPYLCNRINKLYGDNEACVRLSPVDKVYKRTDVKMRLDDYKEIWNIYGLTVLDYQYVYKVFTRESRDGYSLDNIAEIELKQGKLYYNATSLDKLAETDWHKYVDYNIQDVMLLVNLEDKLKYLKICRELANTCLTPLSYTISTVGLVTGLVTQKALEKGKIISTFFNGENSDRRFEGGFVKEPQTGIKKSLLYFDANSLYPNTIVTLNLSPETKIGSYIILQNGDYKIFTINNKEYVLSKEKFDDFVKKNKLSSSKSNVLFTQEHVGLFPEIIMEFYKKRVEIKKLLKHNKTHMVKIDKNSVEYKTLERQNVNLEINQNNIKLLLNKSYGYFAEKHSPLFDIELAESVTLTGQQCIKKASENIVTFFKDKYDVTENVIVYNDTDSVIITIDPILVKEKQELLLNNKITPYVHKLSKDIKTVIDTTINQWAKDELNSFNSSYEFKLENITSAGLFVGKKNYLLHIKNDDEIDCDKYKYVGLEVVKTSTPKKLKPIIKDIIQKGIEQNSKKEVDLLLKNALADFRKLQIEDYAISISLNNYNKYKKMSSGFKMGLHTPWHVKSAIYYNNLLEKHELTNKYESLKGGEKIKVVCLLKNALNINTVAFLKVFPEELKYLIPDVDLMFEKIIFNPINRVFETIGWKLNNPVSDEKMNLFTFFSVENS